MLHLAIGEAGREAGLVDGLAEDVDDHVREVGVARRIVRIRAEYFEAHRRRHAGRAEIKIGRAHARVVRIEDLLQVVRIAVGIVPVELRAGAELALKRQAQRGERSRAGLADAAVGAASRDVIAARKHRRIVEVHDAARQIHVFERDGRTARRPPMVEVGQRIEIRPWIGPGIGAVPERKFEGAAVGLRAWSAIVVEGHIVVDCDGDAQQAVEQRVGNRYARGGRRGVFDEVQAELRIVVIPALEDVGDGIGADQRIGVSDIRRHRSLALLAAAALALLGAGARPDVRAPDQIQRACRAAVDYGNGLAVGGRIARDAERLRLDPRIGKLADHGLNRGVDSRRAIAALISEKGVLPKTATSQAAGFNVSVEAACC